MSKPVMGDKTPRTAQAMEEAGRLPTGDHSYGYMISFAQSLELELAALPPEGREQEFEIVGMWDGSTARWTAYEPVTGDYLFRPRRPQEGRQ
jgi:hypothetical protein